MRAADRRLAALAAMLAPAMAERLLGRLSGGGRARAAATRLALQPRGVRAAALADSLGDLHSSPESLRGALSAERPGVAAALRGLAALPWEPGTSRLAPAPLLSRLCLEWFESYPDPR